MLGKRAGREEDLSFPPVADDMDMVSNGRANHNMLRHQTSPQQATVQQQKPKALRFVTNYGAPHPKRRRIGAACLTCMYLVYEDMIDKDSDEW